MSVSCSCTSQHVVGVGTEVGLDHPQPCVGDGPLPGVLDHELGERGIGRGSGQVTDQASDGPMASALGNDNAETVRVHEVEAQVAVGEL